MFMSRFILTGCHAGQIFMTTQAVCAPVSRGIRSPLIKVVQRDQLIEPPDHNMAFKISLVEGGMDEGLRTYNHFMRRYFWSALQPRYRRSGVLLRSADFPSPTFSTTEHRLSVLQEISSTELRRLILSSPPKSCELYPIPTFLLQEVIDDLLPFLTALCNTSIREASLIDSQKHSILLPVIKQDGLDQNDPVNYRPIANVTFLSKILERIVAIQLISYFDVNEMFPSCQSGFRRNHSTENLLLRLLSDFYSTMARGHVTLLAIFDVSSAFDSVDHSILLQRLTTSFGLVDQPLAWIRSFLSDRFNCVVLCHSRSPWVPAPFGVTEGSDLGPLLYLLGQT